MSIPTGRAKPVGLPSATTPPVSTPVATGDVLFDLIRDHETASTATPWGRVLDAGTGRQSLTWLLSLTGVTRWSAITADEGMARTMREDVLTPCADHSAVEKGTLLVGNWDDPKLCDGEEYDVIIADYLIGAIDGFSPYTQELIIERLRHHLAPGGRLYVIGLQPLPDKAPKPADVICEVRQLRDACILLAGHRCYREFPLEWLERHLKAGGLSIERTEQFPILYTEASIGRQIDVGARKLPLFEVSHCSLSRQYSSVLVIKSFVIVCRSSSRVVPCGNPHALT